MKKVISALVAAALISGTAFATTKKYQGDVQILGGLGVEGTYLENKSAGVTTKNTAEAVSFEFDVQSWHLFGINNFFSAGFMAGVDMGLGGVTALKTKVGDLPSTDEDDLAVSFHTNFFVGPAVAFDVKDVVRFNIGLGLDLGLNMYTQRKDLTTTDDTKLLATYVTPVGIAAEVQAKFCPNKRCSPVVAYRLTNDFATKYYTYDQDTEKTETKDIDSVQTISNSFLVGVSINW